MVHFHFHPQPVNKQELIMDEGINRWLYLQKHIQQINRACNKILGLALALIITKPNINSLNNRIKPNRNN
jgi:hypothetical protein